MKTIFIRLIALVGMIFFGAILALFGFVLGLSVNPNWFWLLAVGLGIMAASVVTIIIIIKRIGARLRQIIPKDMYQRINRFK